jgi:hypothetical protein
MREESVQKAELDRIFLRAPSRRSMLMLMAQKQNHPEQY